MNRRNLLLGAAASMCATGTMAEPAVLVRVVRTKGSRTTYNDEGFSAKQAREMQAGGMMRRSCKGKGVLEVHVRVA